MSVNDAPRTHREIFFDSDRRVGKGIATYGEFDQAAFEGLETIDDVSADPDAMDILADDGRAYVEIARSVVAMESQAAHQVAMDAVAASEPAMDPVAASETAMDAVVASETAMDAVAASETAMDAVVASETAMDAVVASETAYASILDVEFPKTVENAELTHEADRVRYTRQSADDVEAGVGLAQSLSFDDKNTLKIKTRADTLGDANSRFEAVVKIGGDVVLNLDGGNTDFDVRNVDVSEITGREPVELGFSSADFGTNEAYEVDYGRFLLE